MEAHFGSDDALDSPHADGLTAFERLVEAECYQLMLSLSWGGRSLPSQILDLGLLRVDGNKVSVLHQLNDDAGTSLILAYLCGDVPGQLFHAFLADYLGSAGTGYMVTLPCLLPQSIWIAQPVLVSHMAVATGLLALVSSSTISVSHIPGGVSPHQQHASQLDLRSSLVA